MVYNQSLLKPWDFLLFWKCIIYKVQIFTLLWNWRQCCPTPHSDDIGYKRINASFLIILGPETWITYHRSCMDPPFCLYRCIWCIEKKSASTKGGELSNCLAVKLQNYTKDGEAALSFPSTWSWAGGEMMAKFSCSMNPSFSSKLTLLIPWQSSQVSPVLCGQIHV